MDQTGDVQPVGGINEKIEGFFDLCRLTGLDGTQGVIIPEKNVKHLMLKKDVIDAVRNGTFSLYSIRNVDEGLKIMTGREVGEPEEDGTYPEGTINSLVVRRLTEIAESMEKKKEKETEEERENNKEKREEKEDKKGT